jgi:hypothetical protein
MYDFKSIQKIKIPKDYKRSQADLSSLLYKLFGFYLSDLVEYDLNKK